MKTTTLPENILKRMLPEDRRAIRQPTAAEAQAAFSAHSEKHLQRLILNDLLRRQSQGEPIWWVHSRMDKPTKTAAGVPDFVLFINRRPVALECKVGSNDLDEDQRHQREKIEDAGGDYYVIRTFEEYKNAIKTPNL